MRVLVTGHQGYIGAHLVEILKAYGHQVVGCDIGYFQGCEWTALTSPDIEWQRDFREIPAHELVGLDAIMHLAAISNDPMGDLDPELTHLTNGSGTVELAKRAKAAGVPRFLFAGSCSIYGRSRDGALDETAALSPLSAYAEAKAFAESALLSLADENFSPTILRNATAFGSSPMLRIDLVANSLLTCAYCSGTIHMLSDGSPWRPLVHCRDIARAFLALAEANRDVIHAQAINIGANAANYRVLDIAAAVHELLPNAEMVYAEGAGPDPRSYQVSFDKLESLLPNFRMEYNLERGLEELLKHCRDRNFTRDDFTGKRFVRLRSLQEVLGCSLSH